MDDFEDIDGLVEMEMELNGEEAEMEPEHPASAVKRGGLLGRSKDIVHLVQADLDDCDDEELMQLAMESQPELDDIEMAAAHPEDRDAQAQSLVPQNSEQDSDLWPRRQETLPFRNAFDVVGDCINVTSSSGERVYAPVGPSGSLLTVNGPGGIAASIRRIRGTLLSNTIEELMSAVERDQFERVLNETAAEVRMQDQENQAPLKKPPTGSPSSSSPLFSSPLSSSPLPPPKKKKTIHKPSKPHSLWVDKYAPKSFMDLLSDEKTNREVVGWLKSWDQCVFGTPSCATPRVKTRKPLQSNQSNQSTDPLGRPEHKVILLAGPPGLGKTTLAHVVARHCGYRPVEINASDNRNATTLLSRVLDAVEMRSVMGEKRPNCLIIDEIDGAAAGGAAAEGKGAIATLLKVVQATPRSPKPSSPPVAELAGVDDDDDDDDDDDHDEGDHGRSAISKSQTTRRQNQLSKSKRQKKQQFRPLMRPIICICNDLYAPVLRPLRDVASVFHFRRPSPERLAHRLQMVCNAEGMQAEKSTLRMLAERSECDVRSCLNTLQFISKKQRIVRHSDVLTLGLGQKDTTKGAFRVWEELLHVKKTISVIGRVPESPNDRSMRLYSMLSDFGDTELIVTGIFETLPTLKFFDMGLHRTIQVLSNIQDVDRLLRAGWKDPQLMRYLPASTLRASSLVSGPERPVINWPREDGECRRKHAAQKSILQTWMSRMTPQTLVSMATSGIAIIHLLSMLPNVLTPSLRPVSRHLYSKEEQECLNNLVKSLLCLGLLYSQSDGGDGNQEDDERQECDVSLDPPLFFTPPVHRLWKFGCQTGGARLRTMPLATRQLVGHEVELESIRRARRGVDQTGQSAQSLSGAAPSHNTHQSFVPLNLAQRLEQTSRKAVTKGTNNARASSWLDQLKSRAKSLQVRGRNGGTGSSEKERGEMEGEKTKILYKYHEGYTNAVKRPIRMYELL